MTDVASFRDRTWIFCAAWGAPFALSLLTMLDGASPLEIALVAYSGLCFLTEACGIRVTSGKVSFPRRPIPGLPFLTLWRRRVPIDHVDNILVTPSAIGLQAARMRIRNAPVARLLFSTRARKLQFCDLAQAVSPGVEVFRQR